MSFWIFLGLITLLRAGLSIFFPIIGDEGLYWQWGQHLDLSYVAHPPAVAYYIRLMTDIFGDNQFAFRFGAIMLLTLSTILVYQTGQLLYNRSTGYLSAVLFSLLPLFLGGGLFIVPQQIFIFFWLASFYLIVKIVKSGERKWWYLLGVTCGLGLLSDFIMAFFFPAVILYLIIRPEQRHWWTSKEPYLAVLITVLVTSPMISWTIGHHFNSLSFWGSRSSLAVNYLRNLLETLAVQLAVYTPVVFGALFILAKKIFRGNKEEQLLSSLSLPFLLIFSPISFAMALGGHWTAAAYLPVIIYLAHQNNKKVIILTFLSALLINGLVLSYYIFLYPTPYPLTPNQELAAYLRGIKSQNVATYYYANNPGVAGLVSLYGQVETNMAKGQWMQADLWGQPKLQKGDNIVYFIWKDPGLPNKLKPLFRNVTTDGKKRLFAKDSDIAAETEVYQCRGYLGGELP